MWELILIDELYDDRRELVAQEAKFSIKHLPPVSREDWAIAENWNYALTKADGKLVTMLDDYTYCPPKWLMIHYELAQIFNKVQTAILGPTHDVPFPETKWGRGYLMNGKTPLVPKQEALWSIFTDRPEVIAENLRVMRFDGDKPIPRKMFAEVPIHFAYGNICIPIEVYRELNGYDTAYDGAHGFRDNDFAYRMAELGWKVLYDPGNPVYHLWHFSAFRMDHGDFERNKHYFQSKIRRLKIEHSIHQS
jgi:hypothetical protein